MGCLCAALLGCKVNVILCTHFLTGPTQQQDFHTYKCSLHKPFHPAPNFRIISCCFSGKPTANTEQAYLLRLYPLPNSSHLRVNWCQWKQVGWPVDPSEYPPELLAGEDPQKSQGVILTPIVKLFFGRFSKHREDSVIESKSNNHRTSQCKEKLSSL